MDEIEKQRAAREAVHSAVHSSRLVPTQRLIRRYASAFMYRVKREQPAREQPAGDATHAPGGSERRSSDSG